MLINSKDRIWRKFLKDYFNTLMARIPQEDFDEAYKIAEGRDDMLDVQEGMSYDELIIGLLLPKDCDGSE